nr:pentatricopeptide repeat-containing protein At3g06920 [Ipomoea batatas]
MAQLPFQSRHIPFLTPHLFPKFRDSQRMENICVYERGLLSRCESKRSVIFASFKRFMLTSTGNSELQRRTLECSSKFEGLGQGADIVNQKNQEWSSNLDIVRQGVDSICKILESGPWKPSLENALSDNGEKHDTEVVIRVLRKLKDAKIAIDYFRWVERKTSQTHCPEAYNSLLMAMARSKNFEYLEQIFEEMSIAGFGPSSSTCIELVTACVKRRKLKEAFDLIQTMRKFKFRPAFFQHIQL